MSYRKKVTMKQVSFKSHVINTEEYDVSEHRRFLELCHEIDTSLSPGSQYVVRCLGYAIKSDGEECNLQRVVRCVEETVVRFDQLITKAAKNIIWMCDSKLCSDMWRASDHFNEKGYFLDVGTDGIYVDSNFNFKIGGLEHIKRLHETQKPFGDVIESCLTPLTSMSLQAFYTQRLVHVINNWRSKREFHDPYSKDGGKLFPVEKNRFHEELKEFLHTIHRGRLKPDDPDDLDEIPYEYLKYELELRLNDYFNFASMDIDTEEFNSLKEITPFAAYNNGDGPLCTMPDLFFEAILDVQEHARLWNKKLSWQQLKTAILDKAVCMIIPEIDKEVLYMMQCSRDDPRVNRWHDRPFTSREEDRILWDVIQKVCNLVAPDDDVEDEIFYYTTLEERRSMDDFYDSEDQ
uniref:Ankyrin repeat protein n=2 Tax=Steinernema glaseri TaxID=37863 RepID=A0A1I7Y7Q7_9BILA